MKLGTVVRLGTNQCTYNGLAVNGLVKLNTGRGQILVEPSRLHWGQRPPGGFKVGEECEISFDGQTFRGEVSSINPFRATITTSDPLWFGCHFTRRQAAIRKLHGKESHVSGTA